MLNDSFRIRYKAVPVAISEQHSFYPTKLHNHSEFEILFITSGSCTVRIAGKEYFAERKDIIFINPMEVHEVSVNSDTPYSQKYFIDKEYGEWYGYLHYDNSVSTTLKGNIFKGLFHIPRLYMLMSVLEEDGKLERYYR